METGNRLFSLFISAGARSICKIVLIITLISGRQLRGMNKVKIILIKLRSCEFPLQPLSFEW